MLSSAPRGVWGQDPKQVIADRHQPRLVELALADAEDPGIEIDIGQGEGQRFADAQPSAIQQEQDRPKGVRIDAATWMVIGPDCIKPNFHTFAENRGHISALEI